MLLDDQRDDQQRRRQKGAHRAPEPGPEREREKDRERVQRQPSADDGRRDEMAFHEGDPDKSERRHQRGTKRRQRDDADYSEDRESRNRTDDWNEIQRYRERAEAHRIRHTGDRTD